MSLIKNLLKMIMVYSCFFIITKMKPILKLKYIEKINNKKKNTTSEDSITLSENKYIPYESDNANMSNLKINSIRLSNKEKNLIKRKVFSNNLKKSISTSKNEISKNNKIFLSITNI